jgi:predicted RNase H-like nuclease
MESKRRRAKTAPLSEATALFNSDTTTQYPFSNPGNAPSNSTEGVLQRVSLIEQPSRGSLPSFPQKIPGDPAIDDVLDAIVGISAAQCFVNRADRIQRHPPGEQKRNGKGLRMEIWY